MNYSPKLHAQFIGLAPARDRGRVEALNAFLDRAAEHFETSNDVRGPKFHGSTFIRIPALVFTRHYGLFEFLYEKDFYGFKSRPQNYDLKWKPFCELVEPLVAELQYSVRLLGLGEVVPILGEINILPPGASIKPHVDQHTFSHHTHRAHMVLRTNPGACMIGETERRHFAAGSAFLFNNARRHSVENTGDTPRSHLVIDFLPLEYMRHGADHPIPKGTGWTLPSLS